jgi:hypothetical protein
MSEHRPRKIISSSWSKPSNGQDEHRPKKVIGSYFGQPTLHPSLEDTQEALPEQDELDALLNQQDASTARGQQPEAPWLKVPEEPERHQPAQGQSRLGRDIHTGEYVDVSHAARRQGLYLIGMQRMGKSGLIENLVIQDIKQHIGVCVLDPHGELIDHIIARLPDREKEQKVILLDLTSKDAYAGLNLFDCADPTDDDEITKTVNQVTHVFQKAFGISMEATPRIYDYLFNSAYTLIANPGHTMIDIPLLFTDACRQTLLANLSSPDVMKFWDDYKQLPQQDKAREARDMLRRLNDFSHAPLRFIVGKSQSTIDLRTIMDEGKILLVKLDRRRETATALIGSILVALILNASEDRKTHKLFNLYADEFQNFATEDFAILLEQAGKRDIGVNMAHQNRGQLAVSEQQADANLKQRTLSVGSLVVFRAPTDADDLAGQFPKEPPAPEIEWIEEEDGVEEEIQAISQNPVDYLVSARGAHGNRKVGEATQAILMPLSHASDSVLQAGNRFLNTLLVDAMEGRLHVRTREFAVRVKEMIVFHPVVFDRLYTPLLALTPRIDWATVHPEIGRLLISTTALTELSTRTVKLSPLVRTQLELLSQCLFNLVWALIAGQYQPNKLLKLKQDLTDAIIAETIAPFNEPTIPDKYKMHCYKVHSQRDGTYWQCDSVSPQEAKEAYERDRQEAEKKVREEAPKAVSYLVAGLAFLIPHLETLCKGLAADPILVPTGQKRLVPKKHLHIPPRRSEQDMIGEVARVLKKLPRYIARVMITTDDGLEEHTIRTLKPEDGLQDKALQERIARIKEQNIQDGYLRERAKVEEEIRIRQAQCSQPPPEPPPISRRPPR